MFQVLSYRVAGGPVVQVCWGALEQCFDTVHSAVVNAWLRRLGYICMVCTRLNAKADAVPLYWAPLLDMVDSEYERFLAS